MTFRLDDDGRTLLVGDARYGWGTYFHEDLTLFDGGLFHNRQYKVPFENGWQVSLLWGSCTYSTNHDHGLAGSPDDAFTEAPELVEVAVIHRRAGLTEFPNGDSISPYRTAEEVNALLNAVAAWPTDAVGPWPEPFWPRTHRRSRLVEVDPALNAEPHRAGAGAPDEPPWWPTPPRRAGA